MYRYMYCTDTDTDASAPTLELFIKWFVNRAEHTQKAFK